MDEAAAIAAAAAAAVVPAAVVVPAAARAPAKVPTQTVSWHFGAKGLWWLSPRVKNYCAVLTLSRSHAHVAYIIPSS